MEAALISAMLPRFNTAPGTGPRFGPLGVPDELSARIAQPDLTNGELGALTGGALVVYLTTGGQTTDGRTKFDPARPSTVDITEHTAGWWQIDRHMASWRTDPHSGPQILLGASGPARRRLVAGAFRIDTARWGADPEQNSSGSLWKVPLADTGDPDACSLRGRLLADMPFGRARWEHYRWIDATGTLRPHKPQSTGG